MRVWARGLGQFSQSITGSIHLYSITWYIFSSNHDSYNRNYMTTLVVVIYFLPMCILMKLSSFVINLARKKSLEKHRAIRTSKERKPSVYSSIGFGYKAMKTVGAVSIAYIICWLPHFIIVVIQYWGIGLLVDFASYSHTAYETVTTIFHNILPTLNSCINPFIYCVFSQQFRYSIRLVLFTTILGTFICKYLTFSCLTILVSKKSIGKASQQGANKGIQAVVLGSFYLIFPGNFFILP